MNLSIRPATLAQDFDEARKLFRAYGAYLAANPNSAANICIEGFEQEIATLPGKYAAPAGVILLAQVDAAMAGCVALRPTRVKAETSREEQSCEMKRLWIGEAFRGLGLGRKLVVLAVGWAQNEKYEAIYLDTAPAAMPAAQALYQSLGFRQIERYNDNPVPGIVFFRLSLTG